MNIISKIVLIAAITLSCGSSNNDQKVFESEAVRVTVAKASLTASGQFITSSGKLEAMNSANLSTRMMGNISNVKVKVGDKVEKGQLIVTINSRDLLAKKSQVEASILQAQSALQNAEKDFNRFTTLHKKGSASEKELDDMTTRYEMAKAGLEAARQMSNEVEAQFAYANIRAPFTGVVTNTFVKTGDMANPGMSLATIEETGQYQAVVLVSESDISQITKGSIAIVSIKSLESTMRGTVTEISRSAKNTGGQYLVKIDLEESMSEALPGMYVSAQLSSSDGAGKGLLMIPMQALVKKGQLEGVYSIGDNDTAILRWLRLGRELDGKVEVLSGLAPDETFILSAEGRLFNGAKIVR
ncbi:MAG: efflux RND transporter periplasmic adaptor subunit [Cyclobacteriaceae bacterium]